VNNFFSDKAFAKAYFLKHLQNLHDSEIYANDSNDKSKSMCNNNNSTMNKKFNYDLYLPNQQSIHNSITKLYILKPKQL